MMNGALCSETSNLISTGGSRSNEPHFGYSATARPRRDMIDDRTTWDVEARVYAGYSRSLVLSFLLQYSLSLTSVVTLGHLGTTELGAVSIANVVANITGYAIYQGLATSLDTLCPQAFSGGRKTHVGILVQRMICFQWLVTIPIGGLWLSSPWILKRIIPDHRVAELAGKYLRVLVAGAPGYAAFESGKRFTQAQGIFIASLWVLLICALLNAALNWGFVWKLQWGFIGSAIAVSITMNALPILLCVYVALFRGRQCWGGFSKKALTDWKPMVQLSLAGLLMAEAELFAFEVLTLLASRISTKHLAASSIISNIVLVLWLIPYSMSMATGTRVALFMGEGKAQSAQTTARVTSIIACVTGTVSAVILAASRHQLGRIFTGDVQVISLVAESLPICALYQPFDAVASNFHGILRGVGRQKVGAMIGLFGWYLIGMPVSIGTVLGLGWALRGLWFGVALALGFVAITEGTVVYFTNWHQMVENAAKRNLMS